MSVARAHAIALSTVISVAAPLGAGASAAPAEPDFQVQSDLGALDPVASEAQFRAADPAVRACYQAALDKLWWLGGRCEVRVRVAESGAVKGAAIQQPIGNAAVEKCILKAVSGLRFARPKGGREAEVSYGWEFQARARLKRWSEGDVGRQIDAHRRELRSCQRAGAPPAGLRVAFFVLPGGKVASVGVGADARLDDATATCLVQRITALRFDDPLGAVARATYEFPPPEAHDSMLPAVGRALPGRAQGRNRR